MAGFDGIAKRLGGSRLATCGAAAVAGLAVGVAIGRFAFGVSLPNMTATNSLTVSEQQGSLVIANYVDDGKSHAVTLQELLDDSDIATQRNDDGSIRMPTTEQIVSHIRKLVVQDAAERAGIEVTDEERDAYITDTFGLDSMGELASSTGRTEEQTRAMVDAAIAERKMFEREAGEMPDIPDYPTYPEDEDEAKRTQAYAEYIRKIAAEEYADGSWADPEGDFAKALPDFDGKSASYSDAISAYQVIYDRNSERIAELHEKWADWENDILKDCAVSISTLIR